MKVLVTGGAGYIGSHVVRQLTEAGHEVTVLDNLSTGFTEALIHGEALVQGDVGDQTLVEKLLTDKRIEAVMHFAGSILVPESVVNPRKYFQNNTINTFRLVDACIKSGVRNFIFSSTAAVYGLPENGIAQEESELRPVNPYGMSKLMSEYMLKDLSIAHDLKVGILRYFNVAGADPRARMGQRTPQATHLVKVCCETAYGLRSELEVFGTDYSTKDGTCVRDYIHVEDLASAHLKALDYLVNKKESLTVNVGYGQGFSVLEVIEKAQKVTGKNFKVKNSHRRAGDPAVLVAASEKIKKLLHWTPQYNNIETIIEHAWKWEQALRNR